MANDPRRTVDVAIERDDLTALQVLYESVTHADRAKAPSADDLRRVRRVIRDLDRGYTKAFTSAPIVMPCVDLAGAW